MSVVRWMFTDPQLSTSVYVPINPNKMDSPGRPRQMQFSWGSAWGQDRMRGIDRSTPAKEWNFGGVLLTESHYNLLLDWTNKLKILHITDHLGRTFEVVIKKFDPVERLPNALRPWRADYTMTCLILKEL